MAVETVEQHFSEEDVLAQLACGCYLRMQLSQASDGLAIEHGPRRASGMEVRRSFVVEVEIVALKTRQQLLQISLEMEERDWLRVAVQTQRRQIAGGSEGKPTTLVVTVAQLFENF